MEEQPIAPPGVTIKEGLSDDFIERAKKILGREVVKEPTPEELKEMAELLKKVFGVQMAAYLCKQENTTEFSRWVSGKAVPEHYAKNALMRATEVAKALIEKRTYKQAREWMLTPCDYLGRELPMDVILDDPEFVRKAALWTS